MIPITRPVYGSDLESIRQKLGLSVYDACWLFGITMSRWSKLTKKESDIPITDTVVAVEVRMIDEFPEIVECVLPKLTSPQELYGTVRQHYPDASMKYFGLMLGGEGTSGFRWIKSGRRGSPAVYRVAHMIATLMKKSPVKAIENMERIITAESSSRGIRNIWTKGKWTPQKAAAANDDEA